MNKLIEDSELGLPITSRPARSITNLVKRLVGIDLLNEFYGSLNVEAPVADFVAEVVEKLGIECSIDSDLTRKIPQTGPLIVVSNFPHGGIDGLLMLEALLSYRPDTKILADSIFEKAKPLDQVIVPIEDLDQSSIGTLRGLRAARQHIKEGGLLVIFPSQSVATYRKGFVDFGDEEWSLSLMKFIASTSAPIVPAYISGRNSLWYHLIRKFHHRLGTIRLVREMFNKADQTISVSFGQMITLETLGALSPFDQWRRVIVAYIVLLQKLVNEQKRKAIEGEELVVLDDAKQGGEGAKTDSTSMSIEGEEAPKMRMEVKNLSHSARLLSQGVYDLFLADVEAVPSVTKYADSLKARQSRSRAYKFKSDEDPHTRLIFCWDREQERLAAAVRVGYGDEIFDAVGVDGFYCCADFDFSHKFLPMLRSSIEVGGWVIADDYMALSEPKWLLWRGETATLMRSEAHDYLISVVKICSSRSLTARRLIVNHLKTHYYRSDFEKQVIARHPARALMSPIFDEQTMQTLNRRDLMEGFIRVADPTIDALSPMLRRYIQVGGEAVGLCVGREKDHNSVYALAMIDVANLKGGDMRLFHVEQLF